VHVGLFLGKRGEHACIRCMHRIPFSSSPPLPCIYPTIKWIARHAPPPPPLYPHPVPYAIDAGLLACHPLLPFPYRIGKDMRNLSALFPRYAYFDVDGKKLFLKQMEQFAERMRVFVARMKLTDDPVAKEMLQAQTVQLLEASTSIDMVFQA
jgi:hypothetical protein